MTTVIVDRNVLRAIGAKANVKYDQDNSTAANTAAKVIEEIPDFVEVEEKQDGSLGDRVIVTFRGNRAGMMITVGMGPGEHASLSIF